MARCLGPLFPKKDPLSSFANRSTHIYRPILLNSSKTRKERPIRVHARHHVMATKVTLLMATIAMYLRASATEIDQSPERSSLRSYKITSFVSKISTMFGLEDFVPSKSTLATLVVVRWSTKDPQAADVAPRGQISHCVYVPLRY
jgi:hypothetical protein